MSTLKANRYENTASTDGGIDIDSSGNIGLGTSAPNFVMQLNRSGSTAVYQQFTNGSTGTASSDGLQVGINTSGDGIILHNENKAIRVFTNGSERARFLAAGGLTFNGDTAATNALDDYEEGSWTPSIGGNATYTTQEGSYVKIGKLVLAHWRLQINSQGTGSNTSQISGLPFASGKASQNTSNLSWQGLGVGMTYGVYYLGSGGTTLSLSYTTSAQTSLTNNPNSLVDSAAIQGNIVYISS